MAGNTDDIKSGFDWVSKYQPNRFPTGPFIVPKQFVKWDEVQIVLKVNGKTMQDWPTNDMIFSPQKSLSYTQERVKLMPGDLLSTGSPPGNAGQQGGAWLKHGDIVERAPTGLGKQRGCQGA